MNDPKPPSLARLPAGIWALGVVSLLMDVSSEMIHALLPLFMVGTLGMGVAEVGLLEGLAEATALVVKVFSGAISDWVGRRKPLAVLGYGQPQVTLHEFVVSPDPLPLGDKLNLSFTLQSKAEHEQNLVIDFVIHFMKANGQTSGKVFKLKTAVLAPNQSLTVGKSHPIKPITTRTYYPGTHLVEIQVNGQRLGERSFELVLPS